MNPIEILNVAIKHVPSVRYAFGIAGISAAIYIVLQMIPEPRISVPALILMFALMVLLLLFSKLEKVVPNEAFRVPALVMLWIVLVAFSSALTLLFSSYFLSWPKPINEMLTIEEKVMSSTGFFSLPIEQEGDLKTTNYPIDTEISKLLEGIKDYEGPNNPVVRLAIPNLLVRGGNTDQVIGGVIADFIYDFLRQNTSGFSLVEREALTNLTKLEQSIHLEATAEEISIAAMPTGANIVLAGSVSLLGNGVSVLRVRVIDVERRIELAFQTCEKPLEVTNLEVVSNCLGLGILSAITQLKPQPRAILKGGDTLDEKARTSISEARLLQSEGNLEQAQHIYASTLTTPSTHWQAEIDYLRLMYDLGMLTWVKSRSTSLLKLMPFDREHFCSRAQILNEQLRVLESAERAREAVRYASSCGDSVIIARALLEYAKYFERIDLRVTKAAIAEAKKYHGGEENLTWLGCEINHYEYVALFENETNWLGNRSSKFSSIGDACLESGNIRMAVRAYRNAGITAWNVEDGHRHIEKAVDLASQIGGSSLDNSMLQLASSYQKQAKYTQAGKLIINTLGRHIKAIENISGGLSSPLNSLDKDLLQRTGSKGGIASPVFLENDRLIIASHEKGAAKALEAWGELTENYSADQAEQYFTIAKLLDSESTESNSFSDALSKSGFTLKGIIEAADPPLRGSDLNVEEIFDHILNEIYSKEFSSLSEDKQNELFTAATKLAEWRGSKADLFYVLFAHGKEMVRRDNKEKAEDFFYRSSLMIEDQPRLKYLLEGSMRDLIPSENKTAIIQSRRKQVDLAKKYSSHVYVRASYWLQRYLWEETGEEGDSVVKVMLSVFHEMSEIGAYRSAAYSLELSSELFNVVSNVVGSATSVTLMESREEILRALKDPLGGALASADLLWAIWSYHGHRYRGGAEEVFQKDNDVKQIMEYLAPEIREIAENGLQRDASRIVSAIPPQVPAMQELVPLALEWVDSISDSKEYYGLSAELNLLAADNSKEYEKRMEHLEKALEVSEKGQVYVQAGAEIIESAIAFNKPYIDSFEHCYDTAENYNYKRLCFDAVWRSIVNNDKKLEAIPDLKIVYEAGLFLVESYSALSWKPIEQYSLKSALCSMAVALGDYENYFLFHDALEVYYKETEPNEYEWATHLARLAENIEDIDPALSLEVYQQFMESEGPSNYWRAGVYSDIADLAYKQEKYELYEKAINEGIEYAKQYNRKSVPWYVFKRLAPAVQSEDWIKVANIYLDAASAIENYRPNSKHFKDEALYSAARAYAYSNDYQLALELIAQQIDTAHKVAASEVLGPSCYLTSVIKFAQSVNLAAGTCEQAQGYADLALRLEKKCDGSYKFNSWSDGVAYNNWQVENTCNEPPVKNKNLLRYVN